MKTSTLDELIELGQGPIRSVDCVIALEPEVFPEEEEILKRAKLALKLYPTTASLPLILKNYSSLEDFTNGKLKHAERICLGIIQEDGKKLLALKMSHILGDAVSMLLWLKMILSGEGTTAPLKLRKFPAKKDTPYRHSYTSTPWMKNLPQDERRIVLRQELHHPQNGLSYSINDILILSLLRSLKEDRKAIWLPVNVREEFWQGFGNGLSRMRIYPLKGSSTLDELAFIKKQKKENMSNGEVALPPENLDLSHPLKKMLFKLWLNRPWADWGSISLSHLENRGNFPRVHSLWGVTNIIEKHQGGLFAWTQEDKTFLTLTLDWNVPSYEGHELLENIERNFKGILDEIS